MCSLDQLPLGWERVRVTYNTSRGQKEAVEFLSTQRQEFYLHEPLVQTAVKCALLFSLGNPAYFLCYTAMQCIRLITVPVYNASLTALGKELWHLIKLPLYFLGMQVSALYGIINPLEGRALLAEWERALHDGKTRSQAAQRHVNLSEIDPLAQMFLKEEPEWAGFIAFCMQPLGRLSDPRVIHVECLPRHPIA